MVLILEQVGRIEMGYKEFIVYFIDVVVKCIAVNFLFPLKCTSLTAL